MGSVTDMLLEGNFDQSGLVSAGHGHDYHGLMGTLIKPAAREVGFPGNTDLQTGRICQVYLMGFHTEVTGEGRISAGPQAVMTAFRADNTNVAFCKLFEARVAISLAEAFVGLAAAILAANFFEKLNPNGLPNKRVKV